MMYRPCYRVGMVACWTLAEALYLAKQCGSRAAVWSPYTRRVIWRGQAIGRRP